jgi:DNA-binding GntR family transcriptional regulator
MNKPIDSRLALHVRRTESLTSLVRRELEQMIETGELKAGDRLNENALASRLGVSRGPVREACRGLEQRGLVEVIVNRGVFVRALDDKEAAELYDIRAALMRLAGLTLAPRITAKQIGILRRLIAKMDEAGRRNDLNLFYPLNLQFHEAICDFAGNARLTAMALAVQREAHLFRRRTLDMDGRMRASNAEHCRIVDALEAHDAERAAREMEAHVLTSRALLFGAMGTGAPPASRHAGR